MRGPDGLTGGNAVAHGNQRRQHAVAVAHGRHAVLQLQLRCFEHDLALARMVFRQRLVALVDAAVERQVNVGVDEAGHDVFARSRR